MKFLIYVGVLVVTATALSLGLDWLTAPPAKLEASASASDRAAAGSVGQITIARVTAANNGDPNDILTPIYPTSPGKDLPPKPATVIKAAADQKPAATDGRAPADDVSMSPAETAALPTAPSVATSNACNIPACESAYRSFRPEDCSYQPYDGPRRLCEIDHDSTAQAAISPLRNSATPAPVPASGSTRDDAELRAVEREVRQMPMPDYHGDYRHGRFVSEPPDRAYYRGRGYWIDER